MTKFKEFMIRMFDCSYYSGCLTIWEPNEYDWENGTEYLIENLPDFIKVWWDADLYDWENYSWTLAKHASSCFYLWWDAKKYNWEEHSWALSQYCSRYFKKWWNAEKYNYSYFGHLLPEYLPEQFKKWWNPNSYNWEKHSWALPQYCSEYFEQWWDAEKYNLEEFGVYLAKYCSEYSEIKNNNNKNVITVENFEKLICSLEEQYILDYENTYLFEKIFTDGYFVAYPNTIMKQAIVKFLEDVFDDKDKWIDYFIYELNFGKDWCSGCILTDDGNDIILKTAKDLYRVLTERNV